MPRINGQIEGCNKSTWDGCPVPHSIALFANGWDSTFIIQQGTSSHPILR